MAETTTATCLPAAASAATIRAARRMRSRSPIEVPPNFITSRVVSGRVIWLCHPCLHGRMASGFIPAAMAASNDSRTTRKPQRQQGLWTPTTPEASGPSIDPADVARFSAQAAELVGRARTVRAAAQVQSGAAEPSCATGSPSGSGATSARRARLRRSEPAGRRLRRRADRRADAAAGLRGHGRRRLVREHRHGPRPCASRQGLDIAYRAATVEQLEAEGAGPFDVVLTMEVIEHVADPEAFVRACSRLVKPGGMMIVATLNRTLKSLAAGQGRGGIRPALGAGRHPRLATSSSSPTRSGRCCRRNR